MSEFRALSVAAAQAVVWGELARLPAEEVGITAALSRVLAADVLANRDLPPAPVSAMDGYAVRSADVAAPGARLPVVGVIHAGQVAPRALQAGECMRIMTGAPLPPGADAVIRVEESQPDGEAAVFSVSVAAGRDVRPRGESMREGQLMLPAGYTLNPGALGILATVKAARVPVYRLPRVAILSTGDELEALDAPLDLQRIPDSNAYALMAQVQALGIQPVLLGIAPDEPAALASALAEGLDPARFDVLLVSGGSSMGEHDYVQPALASLGVKLHFHRVEMRPGHPVMFGTQEGRCVFGLPGNPVSSMVCFEQLVLPALRRLMGQAQCFRRTLTARLREPVRTRAGRTEFIRVQLARDADGSWSAWPTGAQGSAILLSMAQADGLLIVPAACNGLDAGALAEVQVFESMNYQAAGVSV